jgi:hypothetical protein
VNTAPGQPGNISGPSSGICSSQGLHYSISPVAGATYYQWTVPSGATIVSGQGSTGIVVNFGSSIGNNSSCSSISICVRASNSCGLSALRCLSLSTSAPAQPGAISGVSSGVCGISGVTYCIASVSGATSYQWTVPSGASIVSGQGSTCIVVNFTSGIGINNACGSSAVCVRSVNSCGSSAYRCLPILASAPSQPGCITGSVSPCRNSVKTYTIPSVSGATSYIWTVPNGYTIQSGQGTTSINVLVGSGSGNVTVKAVNSCGMSIPRTLAICSVACRMSVEAPLEEDPFEVTIYPNPAVDRITVFANGKIADCVEIYSATGQLLTKLNNVNEVDLTELSNGIYFMRVSMSNETEVKQFAVAK